MTFRHPFPASQAGFTLVETMIACVLLLVGMASTLSLIAQSGSTTGKTRTREQATNLQRELVEAARSVPYDQVTQNGLASAVRARPALGDSSAGTTGWTIRRRNATYTVSMGVCTVDDPRDGIGAHEAGVFCAATAAPPTAAECTSLINLTAVGTLPGAGLLAGLTVPQLSQLGQCGVDVNLDGTVDGLVNASATLCLLGACGTSPDTNPADYKRIVSLVRWSDGFNLQTSQINNPGLAAAPAVTSLTAPDLVATNNTVTSPLTTSLGLTAEASNAPVTMGLYLDGTGISPAFTKGVANWTTNWNLGSVTATGGQPASNEIVDGSYQLSAKAFDQYGQYGATRSQTIVVNRRAAFAPAHVGAGRNGSSVEIEWTPAKEHDSEGFRVDRRVNTLAVPLLGTPLVVGAWQPVLGCERAIRTSCRDTAAPTPSSLRSVEYSVVGYDRDSGGVRPGDRSISPHPSVDPVQSPPGTPPSLSAVLVNGSVVLTWTAPAGLPVPDHYNIYRGGQSYADRLDSVYITPGQALTHTDTSSGGIGHDYWITAVNSQLGESAQVGPVRK